MLSCCQPGCRVVNRSRACRGGMAGQGARLTQAVRGSTEYAVLNDRSPAGEAHYPGVPGRLGPTRGYLNRCQAALSGPREPLRAASQLTATLQYIHTYGTYECYWYYCGMSLTWHAWVPNKPGILGLRGDDRHWQHRRRNGAKPQAFGALIPSSLLKPEWIKIVHPSCLRRTLEQRKALHSQRT